MPIAHCRQFVDALVPKAFQKYKVPATFEGFVASLKNLENIQIDALDLLVLLYYYLYYCITTCQYLSIFISSVRSSSGYHGLLEIRQQQQATFSDSSNSSDSKVKVKVKGPNMCYIFEKHGIQGYRI